MRLWCWAMLLFVACTDSMNAGGTPVSESMFDPEISALRERAASSFGALDAPAILEDEADRALFELGRQLFFDERLSSDGQVACVTCHLSQFGGADGLAVSVGTAGQMTARNAPTVFNASLQSSQNWRGDRSSLADQAARATLDPVMFGNQDEAEVLERLRDADYQAAFARAFPDGRADEALTLANLGTAIAAFEATLITPGRFDDFLRGQSDALDARERAGLALFLEVGCSDCHASPGLGGERLTKFGVVSPYEQATGSTSVDPGRFEITQRDDDRFVFKAPTLRNVGATGPYFHDGSVIGLQQAVRVMSEVQLGLRLQDYEIDNIVAFLRALTGRVPDWYSEP